ncbi:LOW QUALITY PROTEIN: protein RALF-like 29 [Eutrema salsugineum]|uniref:LOW QUALITY PROTEIN: protein RALF-like 29 n=1 Tax=Eutrema salsugineum TaxID=72664 RepID=UPI000CED2C24|nr:LOW QUALITY PROTEIN: protein RALF-like 29 [Eutrema salsugineum]
MMKTKDFMFVTILIVLCMSISSINAEKVYIPYPGQGNLGKGCDPRFPTPECYLPKPANPYSRGCTLINRCRRIPSLKQFLQKLLRE